MNELSLILKPTPGGWAVYLTDGREVAQFSGPGSKQRALDYVASATRILQAPASARKGPPTRGTC